MHCSASTLIRHGFTWMTCCIVTETFELMPSKLAKLREQLDSLQRLNKVLASLEAVLGLSIGP